MVKNEFEPRPAQLLLVDDNVDNLEVLAVILSQKYQVFSCRSAHEALAALDAVDPEIIMLDIGMSPVDGIECLRAIRARPAYARTPAIAVTAYAREPERRACRDAGFEAVVTKPILDYVELEVLIDTLLERRRAVAEPGPDRFAPTG
jgi:CheY-like chemotaxis protein